MKFDNKTFQQKYEAWKNGADYWKDIRGINLGGDTQAEEPSPEEQQQLDQNVQSILNAYNEGKDVNIAEDIVKPLPFDTPLNEEHPILHKYKGGKNDSINTFVHRMGPLVGQQLNRYGYGDAAYYNVMRQLAYESNYGRSRVARQQHNYGGVGWNGKTYTTYKTDADFVKDYVRLMHTKYGSALRAKSTQDYARALKQKGYYQDSLENYSRNLRGMDSLVKAAHYHRNAHKDAYNYNVQFNDLVQDYEDAKNASPIVINSPSTQQPSTIRADVPTTLIGPTQEEIKAQQQKILNDQKRKMYESLTSTNLPNILSLLPTNNFGKDSYGQKFWQRRGNNLHFKGGKDEVIAGVNPEIRNEYDIFGNGGKYYNSYEGYFDGGQLDDVVVSPSKNDKKLLDVTKKLYKDPYVRQMVYRDALFSYPTDSEQSFNDRLLNYNILYGQSGFPNISVKKALGNYKFRKTYDTDIIKRNHYNPITNTMHIGTGGFVPEISHAFQYNNDIKTPLLPGNNITKNFKKSSYARSGSTEHIAHSTIEPELRRFLDTGDKKYLKLAKEKANKEYKDNGHWWWNKGKDPYLYAPTDYDFVQARNLGYQPGDDGHWPSRNYKTGRYLKSPIHPTLYKGIISDNSLGYYPYYKDGAIYTNTWKGNEPYVDIVENYIQYRSKKKGAKK